jgi:hypothetical protein
MAAMSGPAAILDIDGTLVDSNYQHTLAWYRALRQHDQHIAIWRIHRHIGMGGDQLVASLCGDEVEEKLGEDIRAAEKALYMALIDEVEPLHGARDLIVDLKRLGRAVVLASSAKPDEIEHYLDTGTTAMAAGVMRNPVAQYIDRDMLAQEKAELFSRYPVVVGHRSPIFSPGMSKHMRTRCPVKPLPSSRSRQDVRP